MSPFRSLVPIMRTVFLACACLVGFIVHAHAAQFTFTGPTYSVVTGAFTTSHRLTVVMDIPDEQIPASGSVRVDYQTALPNGVQWTISDGIRTFTESSFAPGTSWRISVTLDNYNAAWWSVRIDDATNTPVIWTEGDSLGYFAVAVDGVTSCGTTSGAVCQPVPSANDVTGQPWAMTMSETTRPTVEIIGAPATVTGTTPFDVTIEFSEDVLNFDAGDIVVGNGAVTSFAAVDGNTYLATITPSGSGALTIDVPASVANDAAGNPNLASSQSATSSTAASDTQRVAASFMLNRANHILSNGPDLLGHLRGSFAGQGGPMGQLSLHGDARGTNLSFATSLGRMEQGAAQVQAAGDIRNGFAPALHGAVTRNYDVWTEVHAASSTNAGNDTVAGIAYAGAHYMLSPDLLVGAMVQIDWADEKSAAGASVDGTGWMAGPYLAGRTSGKEVSFEARALWGQSYNNISPYGSYSDEFQTERWLVAGKLQGNMQVDRFWIRPTGSVSYFEETQAGYMDSLGNAIAAQTISMGQIQAGPELAMDVELGDGMLLQPELGLSGVWNFGMQSGATQAGQAAGSNEFRGRVDAGFNLQNTGGLLLSTSAYYDGIGADGFEAVGGKIGLAVPLN